MKHPITPDYIKELQEHEVFVFGSNLRGIHAGGAANVAMKWGAEWGNGEGLQGQTYALPTMFQTVEELVPHVNKFIAFAKANPDKQFLLTPIGCGIAGFSSEEVAPLFKQVLADGLRNISLPEAFIAILKRK